MILGFTGSKRGPMAAQSSTVFKLFSSLPLHILHHGDCVGSDAVAHEIAKRVDAFIVIHPPIDSSQRAWCKGADKLFSPEPYLIRNREIIKAGIDGLIATPIQYTEVLRSGTWATIRYARKLRRHIWIVLPDGTIKEEYSG